MHKLSVSKTLQARIQGVGARARAHPSGGVSPFKIHYSIVFKHQSIIGRPPLGEILYPPLLSDSIMLAFFLGKENNKLLC